VDVGCISTVDGEAFADGDGVAVSSGVCVGCGVSVGVGVADVGPVGNVDSNRVNGLVAAIGIRASASTSP
jgi:hypothetical protein